MVAWNRSHFSYRTTYRLRSRIPYEGRLALGQTLPRRHGAIGTRPASGTMNLVNKVLYASFTGLARCNF